VVVGLSRQDLVKPFFLLLAASALLPLSAKDDSEIQQASSPDGKYLATTREVPDEEFLSRKDLDRFALVVTDGKGLGYNYWRWLCKRRRVVVMIGWSPDSKFLVMTTASSGGHSPWNFQSYVFCVADRTIRYMDETIGTVLNPDFKFVGPHMVTMTVGPDDDGAVKEINLDRQFPSMEIEATLKTISVNR
jgi:hypothetical protein